MKFKTIWVGKNLKVGKEKEKMAIKKYGDAILTSGIIKINRQLEYGYALSVATPRKKTVRKTIRKRRKK